MRRTREFTLVFCVILVVLATLSSTARAAVHVRTAGDSDDGTTMTKEELVGLRYRADVVKKTSLLRTPPLQRTHRPLGPDRDSDAISPEERVLRGPSCQGAPMIEPGKITKLKVTTPADGEREVAVYVPKSYAAFHKEADSENNYSSVAVQMLFHGLNDECQHFLDAVGLIEYAERDGYVIASACGSLGWLGTAWNAGTCCGFFTEKKPDELAFALAILDTLAAYGVCVDEERVMAVGFSNGAMLSEVFACEKPQIFRAVVSIGGVVEMRPGGEKGLAKCDEAVANSRASNRANVLMVHGDADTQVPWTGSSILGFPDIPKNVAAWVHRNGCDSTPMTTINTSTYVNFIYDKCLPRAPGTGEPDANGGGSLVELVQVRGGQHRWPEDDEFSTTDYIYQFGRRVFGSY